MRDEIVLKGRRLRSTSVLVAACLVAASGSAFANGFGESDPWQFRTTAERANLAGVADVIEKKKGGYYDGFETVVYSTSVTTIGTQVNCNTVADAKGNVADNSQAGSMPTQDANAQLGATSSGNAANDYGQGEAGDTQNTQDNSGDINSAVDGSDVSSSTGSVSVGGTDNDLGNSQDNSGDQFATVDSSTTCDMSGGNLEGLVDVNNTGDVTTNGGPLN